MERREGAALPVRWAYEYDPLGRLTRERRWSAAGTDPPEPSQFTRDVSYVYRSDSSRASETNHLASPAQTDTYTYEPTSQRLSRITCGDGRTTNYTWTPAGQVATETERDAQGDLQREAAYGWGPGDETLLKATVTRPNAPLVEIEYEYDEAETLIARRVVRGGAEEEHVRYLVDRVNPSGNSQVLAEVDGATGAPLRSYTYGEKLRGESAADGSGTFSHLGDALTSTRALTSGGAVAEKKDYTAFGTPLAGDSSLTTYAFTGQRRDAETGLQYHRARWLNTGTGTWASQDAAFDFPFAAGNSYTYAGGDPQQLDFSGTMTLAESIIVSVVVAVNAAGVLGVVGGFLGGADAVAGGGSFRDGFRGGFKSGAGFGFFLGLLWFTPLAGPVTILLEMAGAGFGAHGAYLSFSSGKPAQGLFRSALSLLSIAGLRFPVRGNAYRGNPTTTVTWSKNGRSVTGHVLSQAEKPDLVASFIPRRYAEPFIAQSRGMPLDPDTIIGNPMSFGSWACKVDDIQNVPLQAGSLMEKLSLARGVGYEEGGALIVFSTKNVQMMVPRSVPDDPLFVPTVSGASRTRGGAEQWVYQSFPVRDSDFMVVYEVPGQ